MVHVVEKLYLMVEVVGCPTICRHCWAKGAGYQAMSVGDIAFVLEQAHRFCEEHGLGFSAYPMHEVAAHPQATAILRLFADHVGAVEFQPLTTTGVPLATRQDWAELLTTAAKLGTTTVWLAFHGVDAVHDRQVNRPGAYAETSLAIERVHDAGLRAGCNIFLTKASAAQAGRLIDDLRRLRDRPDKLGGSRLLPVAAATPRRAPRPDAALQPESIVTRIAQAQLLPLRDLVQPRGVHGGGGVRALTGDWPARCPEGEFLELVCRPNLDVHTGTAGWYRQRHGNLRRDGARAVLARALASGGQPDDALWFDLDPVLGVADLAARHGDSRGKAVHFTAASVRYLWLDRAQRAHRS